MLHIRRRLLASVATLGLIVSVLAVTTATPAVAVAPFTAKGSIGQVYTYGHPVGSSVELHDGANALLATGTADAKGAFLFRNLAPATGYTVQEGGQTSDPLTVTAMNDNPGQAFYDGISLHEGFGYLPTRDGTLLSVNVTFPKDNSPGPWPVLVDYSGYDPSQPGDAPQEAQIYPYFGYVVVAVNMRGTTCSGGAFWFFEDAQRTDGYDAIEAAAAQPWSNGKVGMVGISYSGYSQLYVASTRPPHLKAITPLSPFSDAYRGILYPGGVLNNGFALNWALDRQEASAPAAHQWVKNRINGGDTTCANNQVMRLQSQDLASEITPGRFDDPTYSYLDPSSFVPQINVPTYLATQWQDEQTGGYGAEMATVIAQHTKLRAEFTNGTHTDPLGPEEFLRVAEFIDFYVGEKIPKAEGNAFYREGIANGLKSIFGVAVTLSPARFGAYTDYNAALAKFESDPPIRIRYENGGVAGKEGQPYATYVQMYPSWPIPTTGADRWFLQPDGQLAKTAPAIADDQARASSTYTYDPTSKRGHTSDGSTESQWLSHPNVHWDPLAEGKSLSFTTPAYTGKTAYAGTGSADLWVRSSAADTDFEVTLTEVRPDGKEMYIQSGWLRASRRALDTAGSTELRPRSTFQSSDAAPLPAGQFVPVRIELFPFAHIVRPGSKLRVNIEAPGGNQPFWASLALSGTSTNDIGHSTGMPSSIALPKLTDSKTAFYAPNALPSCAVSGVTTQSQSLRNQPCRDYKPGRIPTAVTAAPGPGGATVTWTAPPTWPGGPALTGYRVFPSSGSPVDVGAGATTANVPVSSGGAVTFRVAALFGATVAPQSDASGPVTIVGPTGVTGKPGNGNAVVTWKAPATSGSPVTGYVVTPTPTGGAPLAEQTFNSTAVTQTVTGLTNGTGYTFTVAAKYAAGTGPASTPSPTVQVGAPAAGGFPAKTGNGGATVTWKAPATDGGSPVIGYVVTPYLSGVAQAPVNFGSTAVSQVIGGLTNGGSYSFSVAAVNATGTGAGSPQSVPLVVGAPSQPGFGSATAGVGQARVTWWAPSGNAGPITGYTITPFVNGVAQTPVQIVGNTQSATVTGLTAGTAYTFTIVANNGFGPSVASSPTKAVTPT